MTTRPDAVYNLTRRKLLNDKLTVTDCASQPLKLLNLVVNGLGLDSESALWLTPLHGVPGLPRVFPFDLLYLDQDYRVLETSEVGPGIEFPKYSAEVASALVVPQHTLNLTGTLRGDRLMICPAQQLESLLDEGAKLAAVGRKPVTVTPVALSAAQAQSPAQSVQSAVQPAVQTASDRSGSDEAAIARKEARRFLFERVDQGEPDRPRSAESVQARWTTADQNSSTPGPQKPASPNGRDSQSRAPQKPAIPRPLRSTTTFATSSLPMWHVSEPTAITHSSGLIQDGKGPVPRVEAKPAKVSPVQGNGDRAGQGKMPGGREPSGWPAPIDAPQRPQAVQQDRPAPQERIESPVQKDAERTPPETMTSGAGVSKANRTSVARPAIDPARKTDRSPADQPPRAESKVAIPNTLRSKFRQWFTPSSAPSDRRRAERRYIPDVFAHYFNGGSPKPHAVADISLSGFYLLTEDRWMPGTMIQMTMQRSSRKGERRQSITVLSRIVRRGSDGVGAEFVTPESIDAHSHDVQPSQATDRVALARFL